MDLRPRKRDRFSGFSNAEIERMEQLLTKSQEQTLNQKFCSRLAKAFSRSKDRAGKPIVKWTEVHSWFQNRLKNDFSKDTSSDISKESPVGSESCLLDKACDTFHNSKDGELPGPTELEFEAKSSKDGAWYDVDKFLAHRFLGSGEAEVHVRYAGFGAEEDEWVIIRDAVRERSVPLEHSECQKVNVGDLVVCFQETEEQARYYDAHVLQIQRKLHDIRGCRCVFLIRYDHDETEEKVHLKRLCCRPNTLGLVKSG